MSAKEVAPGVFHVPLRIANVYFVGDSGGEWALVDAGLPGEGHKIRAAAESIYGRGSAPKAIFLTHGHPDHAGSALELARYWRVPVLAHPLELPYLGGESQYPPADPTVGGVLGLLARFSKPGAPDVTPAVQALPSETMGLPGAGWKWVHTPGHSPGHVAFFRRSDGTLLAGDAFTTVNLNSFFASATGLPRVCGPPATATYDWTAAGESVSRLASLQPLTLACGHGRPMSGGEAVRQLAELAVNFHKPRYGRYVQSPAIVGASGVVSLPPKPRDPLPGTALGLGIVGAAGALLALATVRRRSRNRTASRGNTPLQV
ncbi:MAG TPA: MBL fold metallo-hydrolase [Bryobacteraceae bacterium]|nr:MBL fold metallo-hydrolase [Bryobacteraceae bacterium]